VQKLFQEIWGNHKWRSIVQVLTILLIAFINPLGMRSATDQQSRDIYNKVFATFYDSKGQDEIAIILIDENTLNVLDLGYPPSFDLYRTLLENIFITESKAAFFDIAFLDQRGSQASLDSFASSLSLIPTVLSHPESARRIGACAGTKRNNLPELATAATYEAHVAINSYSSHVPLFAEDKCMSEKSRKSAIAKLYEVWCNGRTDCVPLRPNSPDLVVWWGDTYPDGLWEAHPSLKTAKNLCPKQRNDIARMFRTAAQQLFYFSEINPGQLPRICSYHPVIKAEWLIDPDGTGANRAVLQKFLSNRIVIIGADFAAIQDFGISPVFQNIPGAFVHAMALDNLITQHSSYMRPWPDVIGSISLGDFVEFTFLILFEFMGYKLCCVMIKKHGNTQLRARQIVMCKITMISILLSICVGCLTTLFFTEILLFEPINWTGIMTACCVMAYPMFDELLRIQPKSFGTNISNVEEEPKHND